jgi:hypothetical protein
MSDDLTDEAVKALLDAAVAVGDDKTSDLARALLAARADTEAAVALALEEAADGLVNAFLHMRAIYAKEIAAVTPFDPLQAFYEKEGVWSAIGDAKDAIRNLAPPAGVANLAELRDRAENAVEIASVALAERDRLAVENQRLRDRERVLVGALEDVSHGRGMFGVSAQDDLDWALLHLENTLHRLATLATDASALKAEGGGNE